MSGQSSDGGSARQEPPNLTLWALDVALHDLFRATVADREPTGAELRQMRQGMFERATAEWRHDCAAALARLRRPGQAGEG